MNPRHLDLLGLHPDQLGPATPLPAPAGALHGRTDAPPSGTDLRDVPLPGLPKVVVVQLGGDRHRLRVDSNALAGIVPDAAVRGEVDGLVDLDIPDEGASLVLRTDAGRHVLWWVPGGDAELSEVKTDSTPVPPPTPRPLPAPPHLDPPDLTAWLAETDPDGLLAPLPPPASTALGHLARAGALLRQWRPSTPEARRALNAARMTGAPGPLHARVRAWLTGADLAALGDLATVDAQRLADALDDLADGPPERVASLCQHREDLERVAWALGTVDAHRPLRAVLRLIDGELTTDARLAAADHSPLRGASGEAVRRVQHEAWWVADEEEVG